MEINNGKSFSIKTSKGNYSAKKIIVSTGFYDIPYKHDVPGEELNKVRHYYDEPHPYFGMRVAVVGAANSAVDVALETYRKGAKEVTMIVRELNLSETVKYWVKPDVENRIKEGSIKSFFNSNITKIEPFQNEILKTLGRKLVCKRTKRKKLEGNTFLPYPRALPGTVFLFSPLPPSLVRYSVAL